MPFVPRPESLALFLVLLLTPVTVLAQPPPTLHPTTGTFGTSDDASHTLQAYDGRTYGTTSEVVHAMHATSFTPTGFGAATTQSHASDSNRRRWCSSPICTLVAGVSLPDGAQVTKIVLDACLSGAGQISATLLKFPHTSSSEILASVSTAEFDVAVPACTDFPRTLVTPATVNNPTNYYAIEVSIAGGGSSGTSLTGGRVFYRLQVSPAPATATFNDVPTTHPFFPFVEALVAAGITTGCSTTPPLFCPDGPVTRKQMAAFIAKALGLHWAP